MTATVTFEPLPDSEHHQFEPVGIDLHGNGNGNINGRDGIRIYVIGFPRHSLVSSTTTTDSDFDSLSLSSSLSLLDDSPSASEYDDSDTNTSRGSYHSHHDGRSSKFSGKGRSKKVKDVLGTTAAASASTTTTTVSELGFSNQLVEDKLCIVPADQDTPYKMRVVYAAIWLAPGYKVMILPSEGTKIYYQRAIPGNPMWRRINQGYGVDLADPFMTVLDNGIHIKIDTRPNKHAHNRQGRELLRRVLRYLRRSAASLSPSPSLSLSSAISRSSSFPLHPYPHPLVRQVHTEIEGNERHDDDPYQVAACVRVAWTDGPGERMRVAPERGLLSALRAERERRWREIEIEEREREEVLAHAGGRRSSEKLTSTLTPGDAKKGKVGKNDSGTGTSPTGTSTQTTSTLSTDLVQESDRVRARTARTTLPAIPEGEGESEPEQESSRTSNTNTSPPSDSDSDASSRPGRPQRTKSNTTRLSSSSSSSSPPSHSSPSHSSHSHTHSRSSSPSPSPSPGSGTPRERRPHSHSQEEPQPKRSKDSRDSKSSGTLGLGERPTPTPSRRVRSASPRG